MEEGQHYAGRVPRGSQSACLIELLTEDGYILSRIIAPCYPDLWLYCAVYLGDCLAEEREDSLSMGLLLEQQF